MNLVIIDGRISSNIDRVADTRRQRARFLVTTVHGDDIAVEARGSGVDRIVSDWRVGDAVHLKGRITSAGYVAADLLRRSPVESREAVQLAWQELRPFSTIPTPVLAA